MGSHSETPLDQELALTNALDRLAEEFAGVFDRATVEEALHEAHQRLSSRALVVTYLPVMAEHACRQRLHALAAQRNSVEPVEWSASLTLAKPIELITTADPAQPLAS